MRKGHGHIESRDKAIEAAKAAIDKKAKDTVILELKDITIIADYFVVCSGESTTQVRAIVENVEKKLKEHRQKPMGIEGLNTARWVLMDYGDVIIHVFEEETRAYYELEKFWLDAPRIPFEEGS
ncbi:ribosome silencing factor [Dissulfurispira thermophila]|uniref:ribosome silencing factor n=1 Tax=Dissulfurispira thermophila TaxID=2715679 RepID=UPI0030EE62DA